MASLLGGGVASLLGGGVASLLGGGMASLLGGSVASLLGGQESGSAFGAAVCQREGMKPFLPSVSKKILLFLLRQEV